MTKKTYIVYQMQIDSEEIIGRNNNFIMSTLIRKVTAYSKEEAIGKFILESNTIKAKQKLNVDCIELSKLKHL